MIYLLLGRTGSGKDSLLELLKEQGFQNVDSYTTRPRRNQTENTHRFITAEEADTYTDKVATTTINGYEYFATKEQVEAADIYIIDPPGVMELTENMTDSEFVILYVMTSKDIRRERAIGRADDKVEAAKVFASREVDEDARFSEFEQVFDGRYELPSNIVRVDLINNNGDISELKAHADAIIKEKAGGKK